MNPYDAYVNTAKMSMSDREVEASALTKAALLLQNCQEHWGAPDRESKLAEALEFNQKLWSIFQTSLAEPDHPMPVALRQDILRLGVYIDKRIFEVMAYPAAEKLGIIIQINQNLAAGLRSGTAAPEMDRPARFLVEDERETAPVWA
jgi:flagellar protein FlaF